MKKEEVKYIYVKDKDPKEEEKKKKRLIALIVCIFIFVIDLICIAIFIPKYFSKNKEQEDSYVMDENTETRYTNLLSYINKERKDVSKSEMTNIISLQIKEKSLRIALENEELPSYIEIKLPDDYEMDKVMEEFDKDIPLGKYQATIQDEAFTNKELNIENIKGKITSFNSNNYVSGIIKEDNTFKVLTHQAYQEDGNYNYSIVELTNKPLYDICYYIYNR